MKANRGDAPTTQPIRQSWDWLVVLLLAALIAAFALTVTSRDFYSYWTAGHEFARRANPYDADVVQRLEDAAGAHEPWGSLIMLNPPNALPLVLPLGWFGPRLAGLVWSLVLLGCLIVSVRLVCALHGSPAGNISILGYCFVPALACILTGQIPLFALLGLALFLWLHRSYPMAAGASLYLCAVKPHLFVPFGIALLAWIIAAQVWRVLVGAVIALCAGGAFTFLLDPHAWSQYRAMMRMFAPRIVHEFIPCPAVVLRFAIDRNAMWLEFVPAALGAVWALWYFLRHRHHWSWMEHGGLLMLVSILVAPYAWLIDQVVVVPALLHAAYRVRSRAFNAILALASVVIFVEILLGANVHSRWHLWPAPFWLVLYLWAMRSAKRARAADEVISGD